MLHAQQLSAAGQPCLRQVFGVGPWRQRSRSWAGRQFDSREVCPTAAGAHQPPVPQTALKKQFNADGRRTGVRTRCEAPRDGRASMSESQEEEEPPAPKGPPQTPQQKAAELAKRVTYGTLLGIVGGGIILSGKLLYAAMVTLVVFQATQEYYGFITSKGISKGMKPPPPLLSNLTTVLCVSITALSYFTRGKSAVVLAVTAVLLMALQMASVRKPKFSQLASLVFGLFYCGEGGRPGHSLRRRAAAAVAVGGVGESDLGSAGQGSDDRPARRRGAHQRRPAPAAPLAHSRQRRAA